MKKLHRELILGFLVVLLHCTDWGGIADVLYEVTTETRERHQQLGTDLRLDIKPILDLVKNYQSSLNQIHCGHSSKCIFVSVIIWIFLARWRGRLQVKRCPRMIILSDHSHTTNHPNHFKKSATFYLLKYCELLLLEMTMSVVFNLTCSDIIPVTYIFLAI